MLRLFSFSLFLPAIASPVTIAYGHGIGADQSLPMFIANRSVAVSASLKPDFIESSDQPRLMIRTFDTGNNSTIPGISYRIAVEFRNETLLNQRFKSSDGIILADLQPDKNISGWQIVGKESVSPDEPIRSIRFKPNYHKEQDLLRRRSLSYCSHIGTIKHWPFCRR